MAGVKAARGARSRYTSAGYAHGQAKLYAPDVPAGSPQEKLRDLNRIGYEGVDYRSARPWRESPQPVLQAPEVTISRPAPTRGVRRESVRHEDLSEKVLRAAMRERRSAIVCALLLAFILLLTASWGQKMVEGVQLQRDIDMYYSLTQSLNKQSESVNQQIELAKNGELIRNKAQNDLGMLRPERAQKETVYIQMSDLASQPQQDVAEEPKMEALDVLLGLLSVFHIGE